MLENTLRLGMLGMIGDESHPQSKPATILGCAAFGVKGMLTQELYIDIKILFKHPHIPKWPTGRVSYGFGLWMKRIHKHPQTSPTDFCS